MRFQDPYPYGNTCGSTSLLVTTKGRSFEQWSRIRLRHNHWNSRTIFVFRKVRSGNRKQYVLLYIRYTLDQSKALLLLRLTCNLWWERVACPTWAPSQSDHCSQQNVTTQPFYALRDNYNKKFTYSLVSWMLLTVSYWLRVGWPQIAGWWGSSGRSRDHWKLKNYFLSICYAANAHNNVHEPSEQWVDGILFAANAHQEQCAL